MKKQLLIVDDEEPIRRLLLKIFASDYEVFAAADGIEALEIVERQNISLIISDQMMPRLTGVELFRRIAANRPDIGRILLSGYIFKDDLDAALTNGIVHKFLAKPWSIAELKKIVDETSEHIDIAAAA